MTLISNTGSIASIAPGSLNCTGLIVGAMVTGPGTFSVRGDYVRSCAQGTTGGRATYSIPTTDMRPFLPWDQSTQITFSS